MTDADTETTPKTADEAWEKYNAARPRGDIDCGRAFYAGWDAAMAFMANSTLTAGDGQS